MNFSGSMRKIITEALIRWPLSADETADLHEALITVLYSLLCVVVRLTILIFFPISIPILALVIYYKRKKRLPP